MASAQIVALTLDQAHPHEGKKQRVDQRHRQYHREGEFSRFAHSFATRRYAMSDTTKTSQRVTIVFQSTDSPATIAHWPIGQEHISGEKN
jgi:hypothetical protein